MKVLLGIGYVALLLARCESGARELQWRYHEDDTLTRDRQALINLRGYPKAQPATGESGENPTYYAPLHRPQDLL